MFKKYLIVLFAALNLTLFAQPYRKVENNSFARGEKLTFRVAFNSALTGNINAGKATLTLTPEPKVFNGRSSYHAVGEGRTTGLIEAFYHVEERFESFFDEESLAPWQFLRHTRENKYKKDDMVTFKHRERIAVSMNKTTAIPANIQDVISAFYYARTLDVSKLKSGDFIQLPFFLDDSVYHSKIRFKGRETVKTKLGSFKCIALSPMVATGNAFDDPYPVTLWVTDDANRLPVLIVSELSVGRARVEMINYEGIANPITAKVGSK